MQRCCINITDLVTEELLKKFNLSKTCVREEILNVFLENSLPLSVNELKDKMSLDCDRVTLYRNLKKFTTKGILHEVYLDKQDSKYVLPESIVNPDKAYSEHLHFKCVNCEMVKCLTDQEIMNITLPEGFKKVEANFVIYGFCDVCNGQ